MQEVQYQEYNGEGFRIEAKYPVRKHWLMWITRKMWSLEANGREWQVWIFYILYYPMLAVAIVADITILLTVIISYVLYHTIYYAGKQFISILRKVIILAFDKLIYPLLRRLIFWLAVVGAGIVLYYRFDVIREYTLKLFDLIAR